MAARISGTTLLKLYFATQPALSGPVFGAFLPTARKGPWTFRVEAGKFLVP